MSSTEPRSNLSETVKDVVINTIIRGCIPSAYSAFVLVMDNRTMPVIQSAMSKFDLVGAGCALVENLFADRSQMEEMEVIYFLEPRKKNISALLDDFATVQALIPVKSCLDKCLYGNIKLPPVSKCQYGRVHLVFQGRLSDEQLERIKSNKILLDRIVSLKEVNLDFINIEENCFQLGHPTGLVELFGQGGSGEKFCKAVARQLMHLCVTMKEYPYIRYKAEYPCENIARYFHSAMDDYQRTHITWEFNPDRATLFITDRTADNVLPFLHEFTYQAMTYDLLQVSNNSYKYEATTEKGVSEKVILLKDSDPLWKELKHEPITNAQRILQEKLKEFKSRHINVVKLHEGNKSGLSLEQVNHAVQELPEYLAYLSKLSSHINLVRRCLNVFSETKLNATSLIEQSLATLMDSDGKSTSAKTMFKDIEARYNDSSLTMECKIRLLSLLLITQGGVKEDWRKKLIKSGGISIEWESGLGNLRLLGVTLQKGMKTRDGAGRMDKRHVSNSDIVLSRYIPVVKDLIQLEAMRNPKLSKSEYPYVVEPPPLPKSKPLITSNSSRPTSLSSSSSSSSVRPKAARSRRTKRPGAGGPLNPTDEKREWSKGGKSPSEVLAPQQVLYGPKLIFFIAGGMTYAEMRAASEVQKESDREIIIGSTHITTPAEYLEDLKLLEPTISVDI